MDNKYFTDTEDLVFTRKNMIISSEKKTIITDTINNIYTLDKFNHLINDEILKGENVTISTNSENIKNDKYYLDIGFFDLKNNKFLAKDVTIDFDKNRPAPNPVKPALLFLFLSSPHSPWVSFLG